MTTHEQDDEPALLPHQQVSPLWYLQNLALLGAGTGLGYLAGGTAAHLAATEMAPGFIARMDPSHRQMFFRGAGAAAGLGSAFALSQARAAMEARLSQKADERDDARHQARAAQRPAEPKTKSKIAAAMGLT